MTNAQTPSRGQQTDTSRTTARRPAKTGAKAATRGGGRKTTASGGRATAATKTAPAGRSMTVPLVGVKVPMDGVRVPGADVAKQQTLRAAETVRSHLPSMERMLYYGGLGTAALVGVLEWPVAVAAGVGVWVASHTRRSADRPASQ